MTDQAARSHLSPDTVAAYAERRLGDVARANVERHLADCSPCRQEVVQVVRVLRPRTAYRYGGVAALAAAAVLAITVLRTSPSGVVPDSPETAMRDAGGDDSRVALVGPDTLVADGERSPLRFVWANVAPGARYQFALADESGTRIFTTGSADTALVLPDSVRLEQGRTYQWLVDALRPDGRSVTSGVRFLRIGQ